MTDLDIICRCCDATVRTAVHDVCPECGTSVVPPEWWAYQNQHGTVEALERALRAGGYGVVPV
jgi:hypothetical protein